MRVISNAEKIKGFPSPGVVPRKAVNPPDKTSSPIDRQEGGISWLRNNFLKLSLIESAGEKKNYAFNQ